MNNPIAIGLPWAQAFDFPEGFLRPADALRFEFRYAPGDPLPVAEATMVAGVVIEGDRVFLSLETEQTAALKKGTVRTMPLMMRGGRELFLDILIEIEVVQPITRPAS